ncbi:hypothetical protein [Bacteroides reticulotermitis]|uniref:Lipoprotein n=1 Tax=Bacteroides reticulotermitis TaxID=1133319 RepID=A0A840D3I7_9BACE|nr:hypothetical protein [Bacteroides reticulotermitis]MBB4045389.1 hypothetical protein [Bacteroides reticulotermitis]
MKTIKVIALLFVFSCLCFSCNQKQDQLVNLFYQKDDGVLFLANTESATYIQKLELNLEKDTLLLTTYKKDVSGSTKFKASLFSKWRVKLDSTFHIKYLKYGDKAVELSELKSPSKDLIQRFYPSIEIQPEKFPYVVE